MHEHSNTCWFWPRHPGLQLLDVHLNDGLIELQAQRVASTVLDCANPAVSCQDTPSQRTGNSKTSEGLESMLFTPPLHLKTFPLGNLNSLYPHLPFPAKKSEYKPQENVSQTWSNICLHQWHPPGASTVRRGNEPRARGGAYGIPSTLLLLGEPSNLLLAFSLKQGLSPSLRHPSHAMPMATYPACNCMPAQELAETPARLNSLSATCLLSLFIEYHCPSTGLCSQAPGFQSAFWEADRGQACRGRPPCLTPTNSLPRA